MSCVHLQQLFKLCQEQQLKLGGSDLIRVVCHQCGDHEVCPSALVEVDDAKQALQRIDSKQREPTNSVNS